MPKNETPDPKVLQTRLTNIKKEFAKGEINAVQAHIMLIALEKETSIWKLTKAHTFEGMLTREGIVTPNRHRSFKKAVSLDLSVKKYGVAASCRLASLSPDERRKVLRKLEKWCDTHEGVPTYQRVSRYLSSQLSGKKKKTRLQLYKEHCANLERILRKRKIKVPDMPTA